MTVDIGIEPEPDNTPDAPAVVVVDTGDDTSSGDDVATGVMLGTLAARVEELFTRVEELATRTVVAETVADDAVDAVEDVAEEVAEVVAEALAEGEEEPEPVEPDNTPDRVHWSHRSRGELFGRGEN